MARHRTLHSFDDVEIFYEVSVVPDASANLILLHGLGGSLSAWQTEREKLNDLGYSTYALDLRGHGRSGRPMDGDSYQLVNFAKDVLAMMEAEGITRAVLVGHCMGGMVALTTEVLASGLFEALVLIDTTYKPPMFADGLSNRQLLQTLIWLAAFVTPQVRLTAEVDYSSFMGSGDFDVKRIISDVTHTSPHIYLHLLNAILSFDVRPVLKEVKTRSLVIVGDEDRVFPPVISQELSDLLPHSRLIHIPKANHVLVFNNPDEIVTEIDEFLSKRKTTSVGRNWGLGLRRGDQ